MSALRPDRGFCEDPIGPSVLCMQIERALVVIDVQVSFRHRPYYRSDDVPSYLERLQRLIEGAQRSGIPVASEPSASFVAPSTSNGATASTGR